MSTWRGEYEGLRGSVLDFIQREAGTFEELSCAVHAFQYRYNSAYQKFCDLRGIDERAEDWRGIPAVLQQAFKASVLTTFPQELAMKEFRTSGTTGEGFGRHFFYDTSLYDAAIAAGIARLDLGTKRRFFLTASPSEAPHSSLSYMMDQLVGGQEDRFYLKDGLLEEDRLRRDLALSGEAVLVCGTALAFLHLLEQATHDLPLPGGSRILETGGYKGSGRSLLKEELYSRLEGFFHVSPQNIINEYGMTELGSQYYSYGVGNVHRAGHWIRHRVVDPLTRRELMDGETGVLQLFDLANLGSVLAVQTEDLAVRKGDDFILLGRDPAATLRGCSRSADDLLTR